jgi:myo-inositol-1(or 4)-monophosphatase
LSADLELAERAARAGGEVLMSYYGRAPEGLDTKSSVTDLVSDADREAERVIRDLLALERPEDGLVAEEGSRAEAESGRRWVVDPLDGTVNFLYGFPAWAVSVALEDADGLAAGVVHSPVHRETFCAERGRGAFLLAGGERRSLRVRGCRELGRAMVATGFSYEPARRAQQAEVVRELLPRARDIRRAGAAALDLAWLADGRIDAFYEAGLKRWDWAAGHLAIEEAGGAIAWIEGERPCLVAAATPELLEELLPLAG